MSWRSNLKENIIQICQKGKTSNILDEEIDLILEGLVKESEQRISLEFFKIYKKIIELEERLQKIENSLKSIEK